MSRIPYIIVADDDRSVRMVIVHALSKQGYHVSAAPTVASMWDLLNSTHPDLLITDIGFPDGDALELLPRIQEKFSDLNIIMMSARANLLTAIRAQQESIFDYLPKPFELKALLSAVENAFSNHVLSSDKIEKAIAPKSITPSLMGKSPAMQLTFKMLARYAVQSSPVLLQAEQGSSKVEIVQTMLEMGGLETAELVHINLAEIAEDAQFDLLFGKGGIIEKAANKILFINAVECLSSDSQAHLMHLLGRNNSASFVPAKRIFSGTATHLKLRVEQSIFREDLYNLLAATALKIPALRDRKQDIVTLAQYFCEQENQLTGDIKSLDPASFSILKEQKWLNNINELQDVIKQSYNSCAGVLITPEIVESEIRNTQISSQTSPQRHLSKDIEYHLAEYFKSLNGNSPAPDLYQHILHEVERPLIVGTLRYTEGNQIKAAQVLGLNRNTLRKKIRELKLSSKRADYR